MNKKILGIGILLFIVVALIVVGKNLARPDTAPAESTVSTETSDQATSTTTQSQASHTPPKATATPKTSVATLQATPKAIMLDLSNPIVKEHKELLQEYATKDPDFNTYYVIAKWDCGNNCTIGAAIDKRNGKVYMTPVERPSTSFRLGSKFEYYSLSSNLYRVMNDRTLETYAFDGARFTLVDVKDY
jgi:hypothetical protein